MSKTYKEACKLLRAAVRDGASDEALARYIHDANEAMENESED